MEVYCVRCKQKSDTTDIQNVTSKNGRPMLRGTCAVCGNVKMQFVSTVGGDLVTSLNSLTSNIKLPWAKFPGEMHLPGMNFAGPGTNLNARLNPTGSYKEWSKPVDRIDNAAYHHDLAYATFPDTATRNVADRMMIAEMDSIEDPTLRERLERAVIKPIIYTKQKFGLGATAPLKKKISNGLAN